MSYKQDLLKAVKHYCSATGRARSSIGLAILNDAKFFGRLEEGAGCTMDTYEKVMNWFQENTPKKSKPKRSN